MKKGVDEFALDLSTFIGECTLKNEIPDVTAAAYFVLARILHSLDVSGFSQEEVNEMFDRMKSEFADLRSSRKSSPKDNCPE